MESDFESIASSLTNHELFHSPPSMKAQLMQDEKWHTGRMNIEITGLGKQDLCRKVGVYASCRRIAGPTIYLILDRKVSYLDQGIDYAQMSAKKNAPRWIRQLKAIGKWAATPSPASTVSAH